MNCPPQHGKSLTISESLPSWVLGKYPEKNIIVASYDSDFAERFCKKNKPKLRQGLSFREIVMVQMLDNLRKDGFLDIVDYLERVPDA